MSRTGTGYFMHLNSLTANQSHRGSSLLQRKIYGACLILHPVRSLDDGIDLANLQYGTVAPRFV